MLISNTKKKPSEKKRSKGIKAKLRRIKNVAKRMWIPILTKKLLSRFWEDERIVLYANKNATNTLVK